MLSYRKFDLFLILLFLITSISCKKNDVSTTDNNDSNGVDSGATKYKMDTALTIPGAYFSNALKVSKLKPSTIIMDKLIQCINATPEDARIYINIYEFDYTPVMLALQSAYERGVQLNIMMDSSKEGTWKSKNRATAKYLKNFIQPPSQLVLVHNGISATSIDHHKYALFSEIKLRGKAIKNVVFSTSENFTVRELTVLEDAVILSSEGLYNAFIDNWKDMKSHAHSDMRNFEFKNFRSDNGLTNAYFFPRRKNGSWDGGTTVLDLLDNLSDYSQDTILVGMDRWSDGSGQLDIADKLISLNNKGAHIEVITRYKGGAGLGEKLTQKLEKLGDEGGEILFLPKPQIIHSKYMLIKGIWKGTRHHLFIGGTLNYSNPANKNNNNLLLVLIDSPLFKKYVKNYNHIKEIYKN